MKLKTLLGIVCVLGTCSAIEWTKHNLRAETEEVAVKVGRLVEALSLTDINESRRKVAVKMGKEMPDLIWDDSLASIARKSPPNCNQWVHGSDYRFFPIGGDANGAKLVKFVFSFLQTNESTDAKLILQSKIDQMSLMHFELFNPSQTAIGCAESPCTGVIPREIRARKEFGFKGNKYSFRAVCILGKTNTWPSEVLRQL